jgi:hypothetical protein
VQGRSSARGSGRSSRERRGTDSGEAPQTLGRTAMAWKNSGDGVDEQESEEHVRERGSSRRKRELHGSVFIEGREEEERTSGCFMAVINCVYEERD